MEECEILIHNNKQQEKGVLNFLDLLLDEKLIVGQIYIPHKCLSKVSTLNKRLPAKENYEFLLRLALEFPVRSTDKIPETLESYRVIDSTETALSEIGLQTDCYIIARYKNILLENGFFELAVQSILSGADQLGCRERIVRFLEKMLQEENEYQFLYQGSQPFLIYTGDDICYNILTVFAESLGNALKNKGYLVEYFDLSKEDFTAAGRYVDKSFQAVIGMQTYMFSARLVSGSLMADRIRAPKYNFVFDHPIWFCNHLKEHANNLCIFVLDHNYVRFVQQYYQTEVRFFPPGGILKPITDKKRIYDVTFVGSYINNAEEVEVQLKTLSRSERFLVNRFFLNIRRHPDWPAEDSLKIALAHYGKTLIDEEFLELFYSLRKFILYMSYYYRYKLINTLISSNIKVNVFGESWSDCPLRSNPNLIWHKADLSTQECLDIWQQSKITVNIMSWHRNAITERIANSMLQKTVVITERNPYLEGQFQDGRDIIFYELNHLNKVPQIIKSLLNSPDKLIEIGECGYKKALKSHTWDCRADKLLEMAYDDSKSMYYNSLKLD